MIKNLRVRLRNKTQVEGVRERQIKLCVELVKGTRSASAHSREKKPSMSGVERAPGCVLRLVCVYFCKRVDSNRFRSCCFNTSNNEILVR